MMWRSGKTGRKGRDNSDSNSEAIYREPKFNRAIGAVPGKADQNTTGSVHPSPWTVVD